MSAVPSWTRANGEPLFDATIRSTPADFVVTEQCDIDFSGEGEHDFLWVQKTGANTAWVAERLAQHGKVPERDVGYAGMKDRHAITRQWFSVRRVGTVDWQAFSEDGVEILDVQRHRRKLRRGAHSGNEFKIVLRTENPSAAAVDERLAIIARDGVPNYFGEQRFGRDGSNIALCKSMFTGRRLSRAKRGIALSAARSLIFNSILDKRVVQGSWNQIMPGELANLDGSGSVFAVEDVDEELVRRCNEMDIHPSASLWGDGAPRSTGDVAELEITAARSYADIAEGLVAARMEPASRALRLRVSGLRWETNQDSVCLQFGLAKGGYATAVLREIYR